MEDHFADEIQSPQPRSIESIIESGFNVNGLASLRKGMHYFSDEVGIYVAFMLVYTAITMGAGFLPIVGDLSGMLLGPPLLAGFVCYVRLQSRNEFREFSHFFGGFRGGNWPSLVSQGISVQLSIALVVAILVFPFFYQTIQELVGEIVNVTSMGPKQAAEFLMRLYNPQIGLFILIAAIVALAVQTLFCLSPLFIVYRGYSAFQAIGASWKLVTKKFLAFLLFNLILWLILIAGFLMLYIGLLVALPIYYLSLAAAYEEITGD